MASGVQSVTSPFFHGGAFVHRRLVCGLRLPDAAPTFARMDDLLAARLALGRAIGDVERAVGRVRAAQQVDWVSVFASRYREELYGAVRDLVDFRERLEAMRSELA